MENPEKEKLMPVRQYEEDEIDLKELIITILKYKKFIIFFTSLITLSAILYIFSQTPLYQVKSNIQTGYIGEKLLDSPNLVVAKLKIVFHVDDKDFIKKELNETGAYVDSIVEQKKATKFFSVNVLALNNKDGLILQEKVVKYLQKEYQPKIEQYVLSTQNQIDKLETQKENIINIIIPNLKTQIKISKEIYIPKIENKIKILLNEKIPGIKDQIDILKNQQILQLNKKIIFYKKYKIPEINKNIMFYEKKLKEYNLAIKKLYTEFKKSNDTKTMIAAIQMVNYQNLILNLQNKIDNLKIEKVKIINEIIPSIENKIENIEKIDIVKLENEIKNIKEIEIPQLKKEKEKILNIEIKKLQDQIIKYKNQIVEINNKIKILKYNISPANIQNFKVVGGYIYKDTPVKPKKKLIIIVAFITGFILSIFLVFFIEFVKTFNNQNINIDKQNL